MTPLVVMTTIGVPVMLVFEWGWLIVPLAANAAGAIADLWMTMTLLGYPSDVRLEDHESGVRILGNEGDRPPSLSVTAVVWDALSAGAIAAVGALVLIVVGAPILRSTFGIQSFTVGTPGTFSYLFSFSESETAISFGVGPGVVVLGAAIGLVYALARSYRRSRRTTA